MRSASSIRSRAVQVPASSPGLRSVADPGGILVDVITPIAPTAEFAGRYAAP